MSPHREVLKRMDKQVNPYSAPAVATESPSPDQLPVTRRFPVVGLLAFLAVATFITFSLHLGQMTRSPEQQQLPVAASSGFLAVWASTLVSRIRRIWKPTKSRRLVSAIASIAVVVGVGEIYIASPAALLIPLGISVAAIVSGVGSNHPVKNQM